jgi:hypothetical protein
MTDPYTLLGRQLACAARRQELAHPEESGARTSLSGRLNAVALSAALLLSGGAIAIAASGVLDGSPVHPEQPVSPSAGNGVPATGGSHLLALRVADPEGGLPWGMRLVRTTRGELCVQIGRVHDGQLGELGVDGAFGGDRRFHALSPAILPDASGSAASAACVEAGQTMSGYEAGLDRSAAFHSYARQETAAAARKLRSISFGLLGPHAVSITYRNRAELVTHGLDRTTGAYLIVTPAADHITGGVDDAYLGERGFRPRPIGAVSAISYRFGRLVCADGTGGPVHTPCPTPNRNPPERWFDPTRSLNEPLSASLEPQPRADCDAAFLVYPCYRVELTFTAPYAVTTAGSEYDIETSSSCSHARLSGWSIDRNVRRSAMVRTLSTSLYVPCASPQRVKVRYLNEQGPSKRSPHESVIVGATAVLRG